MVVISLLMLGLFIWYVFIRDEGPTVVPNMNYKTKIVNIPVPYEVGIPYSVGTKPITIFKYKTDTAALDSLKLIIYQNEIRIRGLEEEVSISMDFIKYFTKNPKLLELNLNRDTLSLSLLHIDGLVTQNVYPVFLNDFAYRWTYNALTHTKLPPPVIEKSQWANYYAGGGIDVVWLSPYIDFRVEKSWTRIRAYTDFQIGLLKREGSQVRIGVQYKLK